MFRLPLCGLIDLQEQDNFAFIKSTDRLSDGLRCDNGTRIATKKVLIISDYYCGLGVTHPSLVTRRLISGRANVSGLEKRMKAIDR